jgi:hypothetical protein
MTMARLATRRMGRGRRQRLHRLTFPRRSASIERGAQSDPIKSSFAKGWQIPGV